MPCWCVVYFAVVLRARVVHPPRTGRRWPTKTMRPTAAKKLEKQQHPQQRFAINVSCSLSSCALSAPPPPHLLLVLSLHLLVFLSFLAQAQSGAPATDACEEKRKRNKKHRPHPPPGEAESTHIGELLHSLSLSLLCGRRVRSGSHLEIYVITSRDIHGHISRYPWSHLEIYVITSRDHISRYHISRYP